MEVHHSHHPTHKKKWSEYIIEFVMLFTAVTLGFFAENIREHFIEKEREEQYVKIVHEDIVNDIKSLSHIVNSYELKLLREDTLIDLLSNFNTNKTNDLYYLARLNSIREFFIHSKNGFQQLKNAGGLRLIEDIAIVKKIQNYENMVEEMENLQNLTEQLLMNYREKMAVIFRGSVFKTMSKNPNATAIEDRFNRPTNNPSLIQTNQIDLNEFLIKTLYAHNNNLGIYNRAKKLLVEAKILENLLTEKYKIEKAKLE